jgi:hypothetical protein
MLAYYVLIVLMPAGMLLAAGIWVPVAVAGLALSLAWILSMSFKSTRQRTEAGVVLERQVG